MPGKVFYAILFGFLVGVYIRSLLFFPFVYAIALFIASALLLGFSFLYRSYQYMIVVAVCFASVFLGVVRVEMTAYKNTSLLDGYVGETVSLIGNIVDEPGHREKYQRIIFEVDTVEDVSVATGIRILLYAPHEPGFRYGDIIEVEGVLKTPENFVTDTDREFDYIHYLSKDAIYYTMSYATIVLQDHAPRSGIQEKLYIFKNALIKHIENVIPKPESTFLAGITLGARDGLPENVQQKFITTGTVHIVALSGYNISIVANGVQRGFGTIFAQSGGMILGGIAIVLFVLMTGAQATGVRAGIMAILVILARRTGRTYDITRALTLAASLMVLIHPTILLYDISFQLSCIATLGIIYLTPITERWFRFVRFNFLREIIATTFAAQIAVLPFLIYTMGTLSLISFPINILILPFIPVAMFLGFIISLFGFLGSWLTLPFGWFAYKLLHSILAVITWASTVPFAAVTIRIFPWWLMLVLYACIIFFVWRKNHLLSTSR